MKENRILNGLLVLAGISILAGCGGDAPQQGGSAGEIVITGNDLMQFSPTEFTVEAGSEVTVVFRNIGRMPKDAMGHNLAILEQGTDANAFSAAAQRHRDNEYIAPEMEDSVIAATRILGPNEEETLTFTAPSDAGDYPFVCSFPNHTPAGMVGTMHVE